jgi:hypothetical protein
MKGSNDNQSGYANSLQIVLVLLLIIIFSSLTSYAVVSVKNVSGIAKKAIDSKGQVGAPGQQGIQGPIGLAGSMGATGLQGAAGSEGPRGLTGQTGLQGPVGAMGSQGSAGQNAPVNALNAGSAAGDLSGTYPNPLVGKIGGVVVTLGGGSTGDVLAQQSNGSFAPSQPVLPWIVDLEGTGYSGSFSINAKAVIPVDPIGISYGLWSNTVTVPQVTYGAGGHVMLFNSFGASHINTTNDLYDLRVEIYVTDTSQTQTLSINCSLAVTGGINSSGTLLPSNCGVSAQSGSDLSFSTSTGIVTSAGGGTFETQVSYSTFWD